MAYHIWGDGFNFDKLHQAGAWIEKYYRRLTGNTIMWKEKYGTLRFEYIYLWVKDNQEALLFFEIVKRACYKYPDIAGEIVSDVVCMTNHPYYKGYFEGIYWAACRGRWVSSKPPKHWIEASYVD